MELGHRWSWLGIEKGVKCWEQGVRWWCDIVFREEDGISTGLLEQGWANWPWPENLWLARMVMEKGLKIDWRMHGVLSKVRFLTLISVMEEKGECPREESDFCTCYNRRHNSHKQSNSINIFNNTCKSRQMKLNCIYFPRESLQCYTKP